MNSAAITEGELNSIQKSVSNMSKTYQIEALRILHRNKNVVLNESGDNILVNLTTVDLHTLRELQNFVKYVNDQECIIREDENRKNELRQLIQQTEFLETTKAAVCGRGEH